MSVKYGSAVLFSMTIIKSSFVRKLGQEWPIYNSNLQLLQNLDRLKLLKNVDLTIPKANEHCNSGN